LEYLTAMANDRETGPKYPRKTGRILETGRGARLARLLPEQPVQSRRRRPFLFEHACRFDNDVSVQYQQIKKLEGIKPGKGGAGGVPDDDLRFEVGHIVEKYQRRYNPSSLWSKQTKSFVTVTTPVVLPWPLPSGLGCADW
jgi:hypothetical protein